MKMEFAEGNGYKLPVARFQERKFKNIVAVHTDAGYLFPDLMQWRWQLADAMYKEIERLYGEELASEIRHT